jgi:hypothetical protein
MQLWQYCLLVTARSFYMFRTLSATIIRSTKTAVAATGASHAVNYKATYKQVLCVIQAVIEYCDVLKYRLNMKYSC